MVDTDTEKSLLLLVYFHIKVNNFCFLMGVTIFVGYQISGIGLKLSKQKFVTSAATTTTTATTTITAVSYTHLDVYKRQVQSISGYVP